MSRTGLIVAASLAGLAGLVGAAFCLFLANLITYGLYTWTEPQLDSAVVLPLIGIGICLPLGPLVMSLGPTRRRWWKIALVTSLSGLVIASAISWLPVALGLR